MKSEVNDSNMQNPNPSDELRGLQIVHAGSVRCGIFVDEIATIVPWMEPAPLPHASESVLGVVSVQGRMLTVLDLITLTAGEAPSDTSPAGSRQIIALRGDEQLALAVDGVEDLVKITSSAIKSRSESAAALFLGSLQIEGSEVEVLNLRELFSAAIQGRERRRRRF